MRLSKSSLIPSIADALYLGFYPLMLAGLLTLPGVTMISMYFLGMAAAFLIAGLFHRTLLRGVAPVFLMELPTYQFWE